MSDLDLVGEMIRTNSTVKPSSSSSLASSTKSKSKKSLLGLKKDKLIFRFLKKKLESDELKRLKEEMLRSGSSGASVSEQEMSEIMMGSMSSQ